MTFNDAMLGQGFTSQFSFDSPTTGTLFLRKSGSTGYQTGLFSITAPGVPPTITANPVSQTVNVGASVTFTVSATGTAPLAYQWRSARRNISGANSSSYTISNVQESDSAVYDLVVSNSAGSVTSAGATLFVVAPPSIASHPASMSVLIGNRATFTVTPTGSEPFSYQWRKNGIDIAGAILSSYTIGNVQTSDAGSYSVRVSNSAGSVNSNPATLEVILIATEPPTFGTMAWRETTGFDATLRGQAQTAYRIQWSSNLVDWVDLTNLIAPGVLSEFRDRDAAVAKARFYRAVSP